VTYTVEWIPAAGVLAVAFLAVPPLAMLALGVALLVALVILLALVGAVVAIPFLLARAVIQRSRRARPTYTVPTTVPRAS
jgi:hypothetical protein